MFEFLSQDAIQAFLVDAGWLAPLLFIALQAAQVILAPIPMQVFGFAGGYVFGAALGIFYSLIGLVIGTAIAVWLARRFGRPLVRRFVKESTLEKFDSIARNNGVLLLFLIFLFPGFPDDAICFIAGLSPVRIRDVVVVAALGRLPGLAGLSILGEQISTGGDITFTVLIIAVFSLLAGLGYIFKDRIAGIATVDQQEKKDHRS